MATFRKYKNSEGGRWLAQVRVKPFAPVAKSFDGLAPAKEWALKLERELRAQKKRAATRPDVSTLTLKQLVDEFIADPETAALAYKPDLERLLDWWVSHYASSRVVDIGPPLLREARTTLSHGRKPATVNRYLSALRSCWNWGIAAGLIAQEHRWPTRILLTEPTGRVRALDDAELAAILAAASKQGPALYAAVVVAISTGVRKGELLALKWADVDLDGNTLRVTRSKNGESRAVFLPAVAVTALRAVKESKVVSTRHVFLKPDGEPLDRNGLEYRWREIRSDAKLADFRWHDLRHTAASFLAQNGSSLLEIGSVLGHKSPSVTQRYAHLVAGKPVTGHGVFDEKLGKGPQS